MAKRAAKTNGAKRRAKKASSSQRGKTDALAQPARKLARRSASNVPMDYPALLKDIKSRIRAAQIKAALSVNRELIELYWSIGHDIVSRQHMEGWGSGVIDRLSADIRKAFPGIEGFSPSNISRMRAFYLAWAQVGEISAQAVPKKNPAHSAQAVPKSQLSPPPQVVTDIPWGHNVVLLFQVHDPQQRLWYAEQTITHGWSRSILVHQIESNLHGRSGRAVTNFERTLPAPQSDLAREILKDPYNFEFLTLSEEALERDLERGLIEHLKKFLLELGAGFALVGQQYPLEVGGQDYFLDLLFYHLRLRCFVVIDLKVQAFEPEFAGKMNFYLSAVDDQLRHEQDGLSIGLILCKDRNQIIAEYALRDISRPMGVARYNVTRTLPAKLRRSLPSPEQLEAELKKGESEGRLRLEESAE